MAEKLKKILEASACDGWQIRDTKTKGYEYYFIRHALDQNRIKDVRHTELTVFTKSGDGKYIGSASCEVYLNESEETLKTKVDELINRASLVHNPVYSLNQSCGLKQAEQESVQLKKTAADFIGLMDQIHETDTEDINSYEIFVSEKTEHFMNSEGIDFTETWPLSMMEVIVNARNEAHEIELYRMYRSGTCEPSDLKEDIEKTMRYGRDRLITKPTPNLKQCPVVFSGRDAVSLAYWFLERTDAAYIYRRMSDWQKGRPYAKELTGDRVSLKSLVTLANSPSNRAYDSEGAPVREVTFIEDGIVKEFHGSRMFASYIGLEDSFIVANFELSGGTHTEEEIRTGTYLEAVEFSDFQADSLTGDIFGEIRLAYLHTPEGVIPLSGGSVSGNLNTFIHDLKMSREMKQYANAYIPALIRLENVTISGSEE